MKKRNAIMVLLCFLVLFAIPMKVNATNPITLGKGYKRKVSNETFSCYGHPHSFKVSSIRSNNSSIAITYKKDGKFYVKAARRNGYTTIHLYGYCKGCKKYKDVPILVFVN